MNKKQIVITAGIGLICFALSFTVGLFTRKPKEAAPVAANIANGALVINPLTGTSDPISPTGPDEAGPVSNFQAKQANLDKSLKMKQLNSLS